MIFSDIIREALAPEPRGLSRKEPVRSDVVPVRTHTRKKPVNHKQVAVHEALRRAVGS